MLIVCEDDQEKTVVELICKHAKTGSEGNYGDGRIFVSEVQEAYTISSQKQEL